MWSGGGAEKGISMTLKLQEKFRGRRNHTVTFLKITVIQKLFKAFSDTISFGHRMAFDMTI